MAGVDTSLVLRILGRDVNASRTLRKVGREADHTGEKVRNLGDENERAGKKTRKHGDQLERLFKSSQLARVGASGLTTTLVSLAPALLPIGAAAGVATVQLASMTAAAGAAAGVFGAVAVSSFTRMKEASEALTKAQEKLARATTKASKKSAAREVARASKELVGPLGAAAKSYAGLTDAWLRFQQVNEPRTFGVMERAFNTLARAVPKLQPLFFAGAHAAERFVGALEKFVSGGGLDAVVVWLANRAGPAFDAFARVLSKTWDVIVRFASSNGLQTFMAYARDNAPLIGEALRHLAEAIVNIGEALAPIGPVALTAISVLARMIAAIDPTVLGSIVAAFIAVNAAIKVVTLSMALLNVVMALNPFVAIALLIIGLGAAFIYAWKKSETFRAVVTMGFGFLAKIVFESMKLVTRAVLDGFGRILSAAAWAFGWVPGLGDKLRGASAAFDKWKDRTLIALDAVENAALEAIDKLDGIPSEKTITITAVDRYSGVLNSANAAFRSLEGPTVRVNGSRGGGGRASRGFATGVTNLPVPVTAVVGETGKETITLPRGSSVRPASTGGGSAGSGRVVLEIRSGGSRIDDLLVELLRKAIRSRGGDVQVVLGRSG